MNKLIIKYTTHISSLFNIECNIFDLGLKDFIYTDDFYCKTCDTACGYEKTHLYGCYEAQRWSNKYIYYCPKGFIFIAINAIYEFENVSIGIISGPILMGDDELDTKNNITNMSTKNVNDLTEIMLLVFSNISKINNPENIFHEENFLNDIYKAVDNISATSTLEYPMNIEKELQNSIEKGNKEESKELLNVLLGHIFFHSNGDFVIIKSRVTELVVLLSRSAISGGATISEIFALNSNYIKEIDKFNKIETLSIWLTGVISRFISYVFDFNDVKHTDTMYKVVRYIKNNYTSKITLDNVASEVFLSKSYLSKVFKDEMNMNITYYINILKIEKSKSLLLDNKMSLVEISNAIGFTDQSYFTKVFKKIVGISPGKYREKQGKI